MVWEDRKGFNSHPHLGNTRPLGSFLSCTLYVFTTEVWFLAKLTVVFYKRSGSGRFLWPLVVELRYHSPGHVTTNLMHILPIVKLPAFSNIHHKSSYPWRFKCNSAMNHLKCNCQPVAPHRSSHVTKTFTSITLDRKSYSHMRDVMSCHICLVMAPRLICNMTYLDRSSGQVISSVLRLNVQIDLSRSKCICFDTPRREEYGGVKNFSLPFLIQKFFAKSWSYWKEVSDCELSRVSPSN